MQVVQHRAVVRDNRGHAVVVAAEQRLPFTHATHAYLAVELDLGPVARLRTLEHQLVDQLHAQRPEEQPGARERRDDGVVLACTPARTPTTSSNLGSVISMFPSMLPIALFPVKCDFVQMYPFTQYCFFWFSR